MLRLGTEREKLGIIIDQVWTPAYAVDLAGFILDIIQNKSKTFCLYHFSSDVVT